MTKPSHGQSPSLLCILCATLTIFAFGCEQSSAPEPKVLLFDPNKIQQGPIQHESLPEELLTRIKHVHATFADVDGMPLDRWIDDFKRDRDPEGNVRIWEEMELAYNAYCGNRELPLDVRKEVFKIVLMRSMMPDEKVLAQLKLEHISLDDAKSILAGYQGDAKPIEIIQSGQ
ncbi:MAG TPA: hypothetical protein VL096_13950 [Pirellulaceae bacterium]|nr:hypothetical protein [Pirellulaceae bacterium]